MVCIVSQKVEERKTFVVFISTYEWIEEVVTDDIDRSVGSVVQRATA